MSGYASFEEQEVSGQVSVEPSDGFVLTPAVAVIADRALAYLRAGYPVHLCGPTGTGKTTLAFHIASQLNRPIVLLHGDHQLTSTDLIGSPTGTRTSRVVDNYIRSVVRTEEERRELWVDNRLTTACRNGHALIYDEFNRTTAEANNPLLSVFSEGILNMPKASDGRESYLRVHPKFAAILTSNPEEYAGVYRTPDALLDRVITITLDYYDGDTETNIVAARTGVELAFAHQIVEIVRSQRADRTRQHRLTIRAAITIAKVLKMAGLGIDAEHPVVQAIFVDVLGVNPFIAEINKASTPSELAASAEFAASTALAAHSDSASAQSSEPTTPTPSTPSDDLPSALAPALAAIVPERVEPLVTLDPIEEHELKRVVKHKKRSPQPAVAWLNAFEERTPKPS
jgi:nitric oxide reductase NorQ protein